VHCELDDVHCELCFSGQYCKIESFGNIANVAISMSVFLFP